MKIDFSLIISTDKCRAVPNFPDDWARSVVKHFTRGFKSGLCFTSAVQLVVTFMLMRVHL